MKCTQSNACAHHLVTGHHMLVTPDSSWIGSFEHADVHHPSEQLLLKTPASRITFGAGRHPERAEQGSAVLRLPPACLFPPWWQAPVHMLVPPRHHNPGLWTVACSEFPVIQFCVIQFTAARDSRIYRF